MMIGEFALFCFALATLQLHEAVADVRGSPEYLPYGFATFFSGSSCPSGFREIPSAKGRIIISVSDPSEAGLTLHDALDDQQDPTHNHGYRVNVSIPVQNLAADSCCDDQGALNGQYASNGFTDDATSGLPFTQLILCAAENTSLTYKVPYGTVAYFDPNVAACPTNWTAFIEADGRAMVPGYDESPPFASLSAPLSNLEDRAHDHTLSSSLTTDPVTYAGIDGCCNESPSKSGTYDVEGVAANASSNIPYIQLLTCINQNPSFDVDLPSGTFLFSADVGCPPDWSVVTTISGRFILALPYEGQPGASFGGDSIPQDHASPTHAHAFNGTMQLPSTSVGLASGCCAGGYAGAGTYTIEGASSSDYDLFPYLMLAVCQKN